MKSDDDASARDNPSSLATRLLVEIVCQREEAIGHPLPAGEADARAIAQGGSLARRIAVRAHALPGSVDELAAIRRALGLGRALQIGLLVLSLVTGATAAVAALGDGQNLSIPLVLLTLIGVNLFMLLAWIAMQAAGARATSWLGSAWVWMAARFDRRSAHAHAGDATAQAQALRVLARGPGARWRLGAVVHAAWLSYTLAGLLTLALLLVVRRYELSWQTTLLSAQGLQGLAELLSVLPRLLGAAGPESLPLSGELSDADRRGWAWWLVLAVLAYGLLPRLLAGVLCLGLLRRNEPRWERELARPGYARLRERLIPDHAAGGVIDADPAPPARNDLPVPGAEQALPGTPLHAVALEWPEALHQLEGPRWHWIGRADDPDSRAAVLERLREDPVAGLVVAVRASATPDRGLLRFVEEMVRAGCAPTWILLGDLEGLSTRGATAREHRIEDWRRLATAAGASGGLLERDAAPGQVRPLAPERLAA